LVGEKHHLTREITRNKCGTYEKKRGGWPNTCKEKGAKKFSIN
jgi:hypothetical protein